MLSTAYISALYLNSILVAATTPPYKINLHRASISYTDPHPNDYLYGGKNAVDRVSSLARFEIAY